MRNATNKMSTNRSSKRSYALKELLEKQEANLLEIREDLPLEADSQTGNMRTAQFGSDRPALPAQTSSNLSAAIEIFHELIAKEIASAATLLEISEQELKDWIDLQIGVPAKTTLTLLRTMQHWHLDPLYEEIGFTQYEDGNWQVFIGVDGCSRLLNEHTQFNGLVFNQADTLIEGVPESMECSIYRREDYACYCKGVF